MKRIFFFLALTFSIATSGFVVSCSDSEEESVLPPVISLDDEDGIYVVKAGEELVIEPQIENERGAVYSWRTENELLSSQKVFRYTFSESGSVYITFAVTTPAGEDTEEIRVDVADLLVPVISLAVPEDGFTLVEGSELALTPSVMNGDGAMFAWFVNGEKVSEECNYTFSGKTKGTFKLKFQVKGIDGSAEKEFEVHVVDKSEIPFHWVFEQEKFHVSKGRRIRLLPLGIENGDDVVYTWSVNGEVRQTEGNPLFVFSAESEGLYSVHVEAEGAFGIVSHDLAVEVCPEEGTYRRSVTSESRVDWNKVYAFLPAPGQFVNENYTAYTMDEAVNYAENRLRGEMYVSLGGFGGFIVLGFDHSIENSGDYDFQILGNSFDGSSEPGIVWVMQDENGDGLPNDTWYELKGSEYGKPETIADYEVTYFRPEASQMPVQWKDNWGNTGEVDYLSAFHRQDYYYPLWVEEDSYTLRGTRLEPRTEMISANYWVNNEYDWGYADNFSPTDRLTDDDNYEAGVNANHFKISDAVTFDGKPAYLQYIDFVKVCTGVNVKAGWLGENSTEVFGARDYHLVKQQTSLK